MEESKEKFSHLKEEAGEYSYRKPRADTGPTSSSGRNPYPTNSVNSPAAMATEINMYTFMMAVGAVLFVYMYHRYSNTDETSDKQETRVSAKEPKAEEKNQPKTGDNKEARTEEQNKTKTDDKKKPKPDDKKETKPDEKNKPKEDNKKN